MHGSFMLSIIHLEMTRSQPRPMISEPGSTSRRAQLTRSSYLEQQQPSLVVDPTWLHCGDFQHNASTHMTQV